MPHKNGLFATSFATVSPTLATDTPNRWRVKASSYVGTVVTPDVRILVVPKVSTANLFHFLEAGGRRLDKLVRKSSSTRKRETWSPHLQRFTPDISKPCSAGGSHVTTVRPEARSAGIEVSVNLPAQRRLVGLPLPIECRFDEYTADIALNRVLRSACSFAYWDCPV